MNEDLNFEIIDLVFFYFILNCVLNCREKFEGIGGVGVNKFLVYMKQDGNKGKSILRDQFWISVRKIYQFVYIFIQNECY